MHNSNKSNIKACKESVKFYPQFTTRNKNEVEYGPCRSCPVASQEKLNMVTITCAPHVAVENKGKMAKGGFHE